MLERKAFAPILGGTPWHNHESPGLESALIPPKILEPLRRKLRVAHGVLDILVAEIVLNGPGVVSIVGELVAAGVASAGEHFGLVKKSGGCLSLEDAAIFLVEAMGYALCANPHGRELSASQILVRSW